MAGAPVVSQSREDVAAAELLHFVAQNGKPRNRALYSRSALHGSEAIQPDMGDDERLLGADRSHHLGLAVAGAVAGLLAVPTRSHSKVDRRLGALGGGLRLPTVGASPKRTGPVGGCARFALCSLRWPPACLPAASAPHVDGCTQIIQ